VVKKVQLISPRNLELCEPVFEIRAGHRRILQMATADPVPWFFETHVEESQFDGRCQLTSSEAQGIWLDLAHVPHSMTTGLPSTSRSRVICH
jgi:hypothetical protein